MAPLEAKPLLLLYFPLTLTSYTYLTLTSHLPHTRLEPPADTPEAYPFQSTRCVRFGVEDVVRAPPRLG